MAWNRAGVEWSGLDEFPSRSNHLAGEPCAGNPQAGFAEGAVGINAPLPAPSGSPKDDEEGDHAEDDGGAGDIDDGFGAKVHFLADGEGDGF